jgi:arylsulfatase A-like enzyme
MKAITRRDCLKLGALGASAVLWPRDLWSALQGPRRPNIIFILSDDIGYGDVGCYGATRVKTPNVDRLAAEGLKFTDAYAPSAMCSPTRYGVMTGVYPWRRKIRGALDGLAPLNIKPDQVTLPELLNKAGYATAAIGKWHLGLGEGRTDYNVEIKPGPLEVGFDYFFGYPATNDRVPCVYIENHRVVGLQANDPITVDYQKLIGNDPTGTDPNVHLKYPAKKGHDGTIVNGLSRIGYMSGGKAARWVDEDMADTLAAKAVGFIEQHRDRPFFLYFATHDIHAPHLPNRRFIGTSQCGVRGDSIHELDWTVGQVLGALDRLGLAENTLVVFTSDNGGSLVTGYEDGCEKDANGHSPNGPLRGGKYDLYEGGTHVPFIVRWKGQIVHGASNQLVCLVDMAASFAALVGQELTVDAAPDSFNVLPALLGTAKTPIRDHLVIHQGSRGDLAIRKGPWKLIPSARPLKAPADQNQPARRQAPVVELYDLDKDIGETRNVADLHPETVKELSSLLQRIRQDGRSRP